jgi:Holliday junction resolvasome RuvABC endonuclease subunit
MRKPKNIIRVMGIDPGYTCLGWSIIDYNPDDNTKTVIKTGDIKSNYVAKKRKDEILKFNSKMVSSSVLKESINPVFETYKPDYIATEDAFFYRAAFSAYLSIALCINVIETILYEQYQKPLYKYKPKYIKLIFTGNGNASKTLMKETVLNNDSIIFKQKSLVIHDKLSEHIYDSIAVATVFLTQEIIPNLK